MPEPAPDATPDRTKVRIGLALITVVILVSLVMVFVIESTAGRAVMFAIAFTALVRAFLLVRWLRGGGAAAA
jgi:hypothetical protein